MTSEMNRSRIVLAVDDAVENLKFLQAILTLSGYTFFGVSGGQECLQLASRVMPKVILLDIEMKLVDGFETCRRLRNIPEFNDVPIIFVTVRKTETDVETGLATGGNDFIVKPFNYQTLLERVRYWVGRGGRRGLDAQETVNR